MSTSPCPFCNIAQAFPANEHPIPKSPDPELVSPNCHLLLSTPLVLAFLDIMPITQGHVLVIPRTHREKLGDLRGAEGAALGIWLPIVCRAIMKILGQPQGDWNVVQNNGAMAAQVVPHVHYHVIPRNASLPDIRARSWVMFGRSQRDELDDDEGVQIAANIRNQLEIELAEMQSDDLECRKLLGKL